MTRAPPEPERATQEGHIGAVVDGEEGK